jgi:hypothetical protein
MTAPTKMNGMADASRPLAQMLTVLITSVEPGTSWICNIYCGVWFKISLHLKALLTPKDGSPLLFVSAERGSV